MYWVNVRSRASVQRAFRDSILAKRCDVFLSLGDSGDEDDEMGMNQLTFTKPHMSLAYVLAVQGKAEGMKSIEELKKEDHRFHVEGGSWTNNISWVRGYDNVLGPMERSSSLFYERVIKPGISPADSRYRNALFHLLSSQTSCYRYWGQGIWTDYGREICRRTEAVLTHDF